MEHFAKLPEQLRQSLQRYIDFHLVRPTRIREREMVCYKNLAPASVSLENRLRELDAGFSETVLRLIAERGEKDSDVYKRANLSKQLFSKIRSNPDYRPTKSTALALAVALKLNVEQTNDLIGRAGYVLSNSSKFDLIVRFFIEQGNFDIVEINLALYEFDQRLLGG